MITRLTHWALRIALLVLAALPASAALAATADSSLPSFTSPELHIPRIDVESYGSLEVRMTLVNPQQMIFEIAGTGAAGPAATPGATYDLNTGVVNIPVLRAGSANYAAKLQSVGGRQFAVISVSGVELPGQATYTQLCANCHGSDGRGGAVGVTLENCKWCGSADTLASYIDTTMPLGNINACDAACATALAGYLLTAFNTPDQDQSERTLNALAIASDSETLRKASLQLVSRLPTAAEQARVAAEGAAGLRAVLDGMMAEPAFYDRVSEIFNDWLHTNRYLSSNGNEAALSLMGANFPTARWFDTGVRDATYTEYQVLSNNSVALEPLALINHVVKNDLPATEILTADYIMVNGYSAKSYGITDVQFTNEWDPKEFRPARVGVPHAGLLSSLMFLNRYPTTPTNRNRARARVVYDLFLDVDILALDGVRPDGTAVDLANARPTMENPACVKCHSLLDPVASAFQNWNARGAYSAPVPWVRDMFPAGFAGTPVPSTARADQLGWLGEQIAADPRFDTAMVRLLYRGLTGREPLRAPAAGATTAETEAYLTESGVLEGIKAAYIADGRKVKTLVREIVMSPYWRAEGLTNNGFALVHQQTGSARLLSPELLHRKLHALFGFEWRGPLDSYSTSFRNAATARLLNARLYYQQLYGGIDSLSVTERLTDPNGLMAKVQERMANEMACYAVPNDFLEATSGRRLFPYVETTTTTDNSAAIRMNLQYLHRYLLGEELALDSAELNYSYELFSAVLTEGRANLANRTETAPLPTRCRRTRHLFTGETLSGGGLTNDPNYTLRAWIAVVAYLLSDYRFLYE